MAHGSSCKHLLWLEHHHVYMMICLYDFDSLDLLRRAVEHAL